MRHYRSYTDEDIVKYSKSVRSIAGLCVKLGLKPVGGNYYTIKRNLQRLSVSTSHWTGQAWNKGAQLKDWTEYSRPIQFKVHVIKRRGHRCELCKLSAWQNKPITLELHHKDGDRTNNCTKNLLLLCPNCHSFTDTWRGKKNGVVAQLAAGKALKKPKV